MTSSWLESLGKGKLEPPDISKTNYAEFEESEGNVEAINEQIDEFQKTVADQAREIGNYYIRSNDRKIRQFGELGQLTQTGKKIADWTKGYLETKKMWDEWQDGMEKSGLTAQEITVENLTITGVDTDINNQNELEKKEVNLNKEVTAVEGSEDAKNLPPDEQLNLRQIPIRSYETSKDLRLLRDKRLPILRLALENTALNLPEELGGGKMTYNEAIRLGNMDAASHLNDTIDMLIVNDARNFGLTKGELKKYIMVPIFRQGLLREQTTNKAILDAAKIQAKVSSNENLLLKVTSNEGAEGIFNAIEILHGKDTLEYKVAKAQVFTDLDALNEANKFPLADIYELGKQPYPVPGTNNTAPFSTVFGPEYNALVLAAEKRAAAERTNKEQAQKGTEYNWVSVALDNSNEKVDGLITKKGIIAVQNQFFEKFRHRNYPDNLTTAWTKEKELDTAKLQRLNAKLINPTSPITEEDVTFNDPELTERFQKFIGLEISPRNRKQMEEFLGTSLENYITKHYSKNAGQISLTDRYVANAQLSDIYTSTFLQYAAANKIEVNGQFIPDYAGAHKAGMDAVTQKLDQSFGPLKEGVASDTVAFKDNILFNPKGTNYNSTSILHSEVTKKGLQSGDYDIDQEEAFDFGSKGNESFHDSRVENYLKEYKRWNDGGRIGAPPVAPSYFSRVKPDGMSTHNYIVRRAEARGLLEEWSLNPKDYYTDDIPELNFKGSNGNATTYRVISENQYVAAKVLLAGRIPGNNYSTIKTNKGEIVEGSAETMNISEAIGSLQNGNSLGIYGFSNDGQTVQALGLIFSEMSDESLGINPADYKDDEKGLEKARLAAFENLTFDQDFQDKVYMKKYWLNINNDKELGGLTPDNNWCKIAKLDEKACETFNKSITFTINGEEKSAADLTWLQIQRLLPDLGLVLLNNQ